LPTLSHSLSTLFVRTKFLKQGMNPVAGLMLHFAQGSLSPGVTGTAVRVEPIFRDAPHSGFLNMKVIKSPKHAVHT